MTLFQPLFTALLKSLFDPRIVPFSNRYSSRYSSHRSRRYSARCTTAAVRAHRPRCYSGRRRARRYRAVRYSIFTRRRYRRSADGVCRLADGCTQAHSDDELTEWRARFEHRRQQLQLAHQVALEEASGTAFAEELSDRLLGMPADKHNQLVSDDGRYLCIYLLIYFIYFYLFYLLFFF